MSVRLGRSAYPLLMTRQIHFAQGMGVILPQSVAYEWQFSIYEGVGSF